MMSSIPDKAKVNAKRYVESLLVRLIEECKSFPQSVEKTYHKPYRNAVMVRRCLQNKAPKYLSDHCIPITAVSSRHLQSANQHQLTVPLSADYLWPSGFLCGGPDGLELTTD